MKVFLKIVFAFFISISWYLLGGAGSEEMSVIFFFIVLAALFVRPFRSNNTVFKERYIEKLKENIKKTQEVNEQFSREKNNVYKDFRKKEKR